MKKHYEIAVFSGDGIGPEITDPTVKILGLLADSAACYGLDFTDTPAGAELYAATGVSFPDESLTVAKRADAILLSAMGMPDAR